MNLAWKWSLVLGLSALVCGPALAQTPTRGTHMYLAWSPNGQTLAYSAYSLGRPQILLASSAGGPGLAISVLPPGANNPQWTRDGSGIRFTAPVDGQRDVHIIVTASQEVRQLTRTAASEGDAAVSPDGRLIAYVAPNGAHRALWLAGPDGDDARVLLSSEQLDYFSPVWSPDGTRLTFYSEARDNRDQIWIVDATSGNARRVTDGTGHNTFPSWSPDGTHLLYTRSSGDPGASDGELISHPLDGPPVALGVSGGVFVGVWSPDGKSVAFTRFGADAAAPFDTDLIIADADGRNERVIGR